MAGSNAQVSSKSWSAVAAMRDDEPSVGHRYRLRVLARARGRAPADGSTRFHARSWSRNRTTRDRRRWCHSIRRRSNRNRNHPGRWRWRCRTVPWAAEIELGPGVLPMSKLQRSPRTMPSLIATADNEQAVVPGVDDEVVSPAAERTAALAGQSHPGRILAAPGRKLRR